MATANNEFFEALSALEKERGLPEDYLIDKIKAAIVIAVKKDYEVEDDNVVVDIDPELGDDFYPQFCQNIEILMPLLDRML